MTDVPQNIIPLSYAGLRTDGHIGCPGVKQGPSSGATLFKAQHPDVAVNIQIPTRTWNEKKNTQSESAVEWNSNGLRCAE